MQKRGGHIVWSVDHPRGKGEETRRVMKWGDERTGGNRGEGERK